MDVMLPGADGLTVSRQLRQQKVSAPILMLTARDAVDDRVRGLEAGADDYMVKPFAMRELLAPVRALARRHLPDRTSVLTAARPLPATAPPPPQAHPTAPHLTPPEFP